MPHNTRCPCLSGNTFGACCGPIIEGVPAPTAERLMRSRFTAFALGDAEYLRRSWHPTTRPAEMELDDSLRWTRLDIRSTSAGGPFDREGEVEFEAFYRDNGVQQSVRERSRFVRIGRDWLYLDGVQSPLA